MQTTFILGSSLALLSLFLSNDSSPHLRNWIYESSVPLLLLSKCLGIGARWKKRLGGTRCNWIGRKCLILKTLPKAQRTRGLSSYHKITVCSSQILNTLQFQNLDYALTLKSQPSISNSTKSKVKILTKLSFRILTKNQLRNLNETSAAKY